MAAHRTLHVSILNETLTVSGVVRRHDQRRSQPLTHILVPWLMTLPTPPRPKLSVLDRMLHREIVARDASPPPEFLGQSRARVYRVDFGFMLVTT